MATASESSGEDIPSRKQLNKAASKQIEMDLKDVAEDDDEDSLDEEEYVVEKIMKHKFEKNGTLLLHVKWQGWEMKDSTWEPEENLLTAPEELDAYYSEIGGKPVFSKPGAKDKKRKLSQAAADTPSPATDRGRNNKKPKETRAPPASPGKKVFPTGLWEDEILSVDTLEEVNGVIWALPTWKDGSRTRHETRVAYQKFPQKMLQFYEAHLTFNIAKRPEDERLVERPAPQTNGGQKAIEKSEPAKTDKDRGAIDDDEDMLNVKGVATAIA